MMQALFEQFVKERTYLKNVTPKTLTYYRQSWAAFCRSVGSPIPDTITRKQLVDFVVHMRQSGLSTVSCNTYISGVNAFFNWLFEEGHLPEKLAVKKLKVEQRLIKTFSETQIRAILSFKPKTFFEWRLYSLLCLLIDTGIRIEEALTITRDKVDFDNMLLTVRGKGNKERIVPMSESFLLTDSIMLFFDMVVSIFCFSASELAALP